MNLQGQTIKNFESLNQKFSLVKAKVYGFFLKEEELQFYYPKQNTLEALYAYSLQYYRIGKIKKSFRKP